MSKEAANYDAISKPTLENLIAYLHYQYPATRGDILLKELCEYISERYKPETQSGLDEGEV